MTNVPDTLEGAIAQAREATTAALDDGWTRIQVELVIPELKIMPVAEQFLPAIDGRGAGLRVIFPDAGAAALARRDWGDTPYTVRGMRDVNAAIQPEETLILFIEPSSVEVAEVEALCNQAGDRPVILLNPRLEDIATVGIGYAARQLRERFLNTFDSCYYLFAFDGGIIFRCYPSAWQVYKEAEAGYELLAEFPKRPNSDQLDELFAPPPSDVDAARNDVPAPRKRGILGELQNLFKALSQ